jgi:hypothetical protein
MLSHVAKLGAKLALLGLLQFGIDLGGKLKNPLIV